MPALHSAWLHTLVTEHATATNTTGDALQVVCAWPVSGQYGPGTRVLYYALIAACVFARKAEWIKNACLAAALLFPAVAALHGIVLAAVHVNTAVDMDVYGAFQICSIGILAAPVAVRLSNTYFYDPGRNAIFLWTILILAGLLSLTVEFFRAQTSACTHDDFGHPIFPTEGDFFNYNTSCGLICSVNEGPFSPMRGGSANNIYVIPAPDKLTFGTATLLAAACCIPAVLSLISMWNKILEINWKSRFGDRNRDELHEQIEGTNGATIENMTRVNNLVRLFLKAVEVPVFGAIVLLLIIFGERNFFSSQVNYQTEPIASIGQWAPVVGTGLAVLGSLYVLIATGGAAVKNEPNPDAPKPCPHCSKQQMTVAPLTGSSASVATPEATDMRRSSSDSGRATAGDIAHTTSRPSLRSLDIGNRRKVAKVLSSVGNYLSTAAPDRFDDSDFKHGKAVDFPEIPGEESRNHKLHQIREQYNPDRDADGNATPVLRNRPSRAGSFTGSVASRLGVEGVATSRTASPHSPRSLRSPSPLLSPAPLRQGASRWLTERTSSDLQRSSSSAFAGSIGEKPPQQGATLEVPSAVYHSPMRSNLSPTSIATTLSRPHRPPAIVVSADSDMSSPVPTPSSPTPPASYTPSEPLTEPSTAASPPSS